MTRSSPLIFGKNRRGRHVTIDAKERAAHMHVIGNSGTGKTKFLESLVRQDIAAGRGLCLIDPHGTLYSNIVDWCAVNRRALGSRMIRVVDLNLDAWSFGFNPFQHADDIDINVRVDSIVDACAQVWGKEDPARTPQLKRCLRALFYCLAVKRRTLREAHALLDATDAQGIRRYLTSDLEDPVFATEWQNFNAMRPWDFMEYFDSTASHLTEFLSAPVIRDTICKEVGIDFRQCMDDGEIVLVNLNAPNRLSESNAKLLGSLIVNELFLSARSRCEGSREFYLYIDDCGEFLNDGIARILDQTSKFGLHCVLSHQRLGQLHEAGEGIYNAVMGQAQTKVVFGLGDESDAAQMARNIFIGELNLEQVKHTFDKPVLVDTEIEWLASESSTIGESTFSSTTDGASQLSVVTTTADGEDVLREAIGTGSQEASTEGKISSWTSTYGGYESRRPIFKTLPTQGKTFEEIVYEASAKLANQPVRHAVIKIPNRHSIGIITPDIQASFASEDAVAELVGVLIENSDFACPRVEVQNEYKLGIQNLLADADASKPVAFRKTTES